MGALWLPRFEKRFNELEASCLPVAKKILAHGKSCKGIILIDFMECGPTISAETEVSSPPQTFRALDMESGVAAWQSCISCYCVHTCMVVKQSLGGVGATMLGHAQLIWFGP